MKKIISNQRIGNKENGITLIALVITIIVLLILAGVAIATLTGENGILTQAEISKEETQIAEEDELRKLTALEASANLENTTYIDNITGKTVTIPKKCAVSQVDGENTLKDGLVIIDANGNEWVWIEVPETEMPENLTFENEIEYETLETALQNYVLEYRNDNYSDIWDSEEQHGFATKEEYNAVKNQILKQIYEDHGFFIGRYEVGSFDEPVTEENTTRTPVIQKGAYPYNYVSCKDSNKIAERLSVGESKSSLMLGLQWDLACKYLEENAEKLGDTKEERQEKIKNDSTEWGNYYNAEFLVTGKDKYAIYYASTFILSEWKNVNGEYLKPSMGEEGKNLLTTGAEERNSALNIYDFAGNLYEWTLEKSNANNNPTKRSGNAYGEGSAAGRNSTTSTISGGIGFRVVLY